MLEKVVGEGANRCARGGRAPLQLNGYGLGHRELHLFARWARVLRPDRNEVIPLVEMLSNGSFKSTNDFLAQFEPRLA